jgi:hypothetical protein
MTDSEMKTLFRIVAELQKNIIELHNENDANALSIIELKGRLDKLESK